jgi:aminoglycoside phosphotransferase (APT) family kinase protein
VYAGSIPCDRAHWLVTVAAPMKGCFAWCDENYRHSIAAFAKLHALDPAPFLNALPTTFGAQPTRQVLSQLRMNIHLLHTIVRASDRESAGLVDRLVDVAPRVADIRTRSPRRFVHGDAAVDNWVWKRSTRPQLVDWELTRLDDPLWDLQALLLPLDQPAAQTYVALHQEQSGEGRSGCDGFEARYEAARWEYMLRLAAWYAIQALEGRPGAGEPPTKFTGDPAGPPEDYQTLTLRALAGLDRADSRLRRLRSWSRR